jgi:hypothetical protein
MRRYIILVYLLCAFIVSLTITLSIVVGNNSKQFDIKLYEKYMPGQSVYSSQCDKVIWHNTYYSQRLNSAPAFSCTILFTHNPVVSVSLTIEDSHIITYTIISFDPGRVQFDDILDDYSNVILKPYRKYVIVYDKNILSAVLNYMLRPSKTYNWQKNMGVLFVRRPYIVVADNITIYTNWKKGTDLFGVSQLIIRK